MKANRAEAQAEPRPEVSVPQDSLEAKAEMTPQAATESTAKELKDQLLRALAEMDNTRKRAQKDVEEANKYAVAGLARDLINVLENLHRAAESVPQEALQQNEVLQNFFKGVEITRNELLKIFDKYGIRRIDPQGEKFDHRYHQALMQVEDPGVAAGAIVQVMQAGYVMKERLLRPALVSVAKEPSSEQA